MPFSRPVLDINCKVDFYAGGDKALKKLKPIYDALPESRQGVIYTKNFGNYMPGEDPLVVSDPNDLTTVFYAGEERPFILIEFEYHNKTRGLLGAVSLFMFNNPQSMFQRSTFIENYQQATAFESSEDAASKLVEFIIGIAPKHRDTCNGDTVGLLYMAFGDKAASAVKRSVATLKRIGYSYPVCVVGDKPVDGFQFIQWTGESPFDPTQKRNFQFRAGRIKPFLAELSPFKRTLYLDADTEFIQDIYHGFEVLDRYDIALTQETLKVGELYNKFMAGWEINIEERAQTVKELNNADEYFVNSGVIFFKKTANTKETFCNWHEEWMRYQQWDEQLALMRAVARVSKLKVQYLPVIWNHPHPEEDAIIFHNYGRGNIRMSVS